MKTQSDRRNTPVSCETLQMLSAVLQAAFRVHCTGDTVDGMGSWELVRQVQQKLTELGQGQVAVSEERLAQFLEAASAGPRSTEAPALKLFEAN